MKPFDIIFLTIGYPDADDETNMYSELVFELSNLDVRVLVVAPSLDSVRAGLRSERGIHVLRVPVGDLYPTNLFRKALSNFVLPFRYYLALRTHLIKWMPTWIVTPTPPITLMPLVWYIKLRVKAKAYLILRDIFPQNAIDLGFFSKRGIIYLIFRQLEKFGYSISDLIGVMSSGNEKYIVDHNPKLDSSKLTMFPNWIDERYLVFGINREDSRAQLQVSDHEFLVIFGGNLGKPQRPEFLLDVAHEVRNDPRIRLLIVGSGTESARLKRAVNQQRLENISIVDRMSRSEYQRLLAAADLGIILLSDMFTIPNIPSRLMGYWAAGVPVLAATDTFTDLNESFLRKYHAGQWVVMGDTKEFVSKLKWFASHPEASKGMGKRGQEAIIKNFTAKKAGMLLLEQMRAIV